MRYKQINNICVWTSHTCSKDYL